MELAVTEAVKPSVEDINLVLQAAASAPLQNMKHAQALNQALVSLENHFTALHAPAAPEKPVEKPNP